jgi:hypothetical protein
MLNYTKGKWQVRANVDGNGNENDYPLCITVEHAEDYYLVAGVYEGSDAKLISAAPDMYNALKALAVLVENKECAKGKELTNAFAALIKAGG